MLYFIITTSLYKQCKIRKSQYITAITKLKYVLYDLEIENYKIIIVENNNNKSTFLDMFVEENNPQGSCTTFYTANNFLKTNNKGYKELKDVLDCIEKFKINDDDFIVKMTGRYILEDYSEFINVVKNINKTKYHCIIKYGSYLNPVNFKMKDCITGLIGLSCRYVKMIEKPNENECVEWKWAEITYLIKDEEIYKVNKLGISICPGSDKYFKV